MEVKHIDLPQEMQRAMARQAEAERERRAKVINAEGEHQAADRLAQAATIIEKHPVALQLRYLQTLREVASENNSTTLFPIPIDLFKPFTDMTKALKKGLDGAIDGGLAKRRKGVATMSAEEVKEKDEKTVEVELPELTRPLEKMTVKELREIGLLVPTMVGVHSMKKTELVEQLTEVYGLETDTKKKVEGISDLKARIREFKAIKAEAQQAGDKDKINI